MIDNLRHKAFLENYAKTFDPIGSFRAAGLRSGQQGEERAAAQALLEIPEHIEYLKFLVSQREEKPIDGDRVLEELAKIAFSSIVDACDWTSTGVVLKPPSAIPADKMGAIKKVSTHSDAAGNRNITVEMHDKLGALRMLAKHHNVDVGLNDLISRVRSYGYEVVDTTITNEDEVETEQ